MSNLGFQTIYSVINETEEFSCERAFFERNEKKPTSIETNRLITDFDLIIFSVSFEIDFFNIIEFLKQANIEVYRDKRKLSPPIVAGGIGITLNYKPLLKIVDYFLIGEGEELVIDFLNAFFTKKDLTINGLVISEENNFTERRVYRGDKIAHSLIATGNTEFADTFLIEVARGCPFACNFCAVKHNYSPYRIKKYEKIIETIENSIKIFKKVGIVGASVTSHPDFLKITEWLNQKNIGFSLTSLRLDTVNEELLDSILAGGSSNFAVAVEACDEELRKKINKKLTDDQIFNALEKFVNKKVLNLKVYIIIGFPFEDFSHIEKIIKFIRKIKEIYLSKKSYLKHFGKITISVNPFIPKPNTPFFKYKMDNEDSLIMKIKYLQKKFKKMPNVRLIHENIYKSYIQGLLSKGDEEVGDLIIKKVNENIPDKRFFKLYNKFFKKYNVI